MSSLIFYSPKAEGYEVEVIKSDSPHTSVELVFSVTSLRPQQEFWAALRIQTDPDWHVYWRNPGDSGTAPKLEFDFAKNEALSIGEFQWPTPKKIRVPPLVNYGYEGEVFLPLKMKAPDSFAANQDHWTFQAESSWLVCKEICLPGKRSFQVRMPISDSIDSISESESRWAPFIQEALKQVPNPLNKGFYNLDLVESELKIELLIKDIKDFRELSFEEVEIEFFPFKKAELKNSGHQWELIENKFIGRIPLKPRRQNALEKQNLDSMEGVIRISAPSMMKGFELSAEDRQKESSLAGISFKMLLFAFLGGLLLNLMPCVFPVISLKVLSLVEDREHGHFRSAGLFYSLGVFTCFFILVFLLLLIKAAGAQLGWGFQLQYPSFVAFLACLFFVLGLNLLGVFDWGGGLMGKGQSMSAKKGASGAFFSGLLAVVVATPCTAPFMGAAMGYALSQNAWVTFLSFAFLATGFALPYLLFAFYPKLLAFLPRPGAWMETLKQFLAFPLFGAAVWLVWVFTLQKDAYAMVALLFALLALGLLIWWMQASVGKVLKKAGALLFLASFIFLYAKSIDSTKRGSSKEQVSAEGVWEPFSEELFNRYRKESEAVFIDFTAAWCVTCQVNKRTVLSQSDIQARFEELDVRLLRADWTNENPEVTLALERLGRRGVPVYALYLPQKKDAVLLPEILTKNMVFDALKPLEGESL
jgi:thiol:disulfide interchange protein DsbD